LNPFSDVLPPEVGLVVNLWQLLVLYFHEKGQQLSLHFLYRHGGQQTGTDAVGTILFFKELSQILLNILMP